MKLIADTREQLPYEFKNPMITDTLQIGDYSIAGLQDSISIERKTLPDLIHCLSQGRDRFERELFKARSLDFFAVVVECTLEDIAEHRYASMMLPTAALQSLVAFSVRYHLPIFFAGDRRSAQYLTESLLLKFHRELTKKLEAAQ